MKPSKSRNPPHSEPRLLLSGVLALLVHIVFIALLVFGFNWKTRPPEGMVVDLWQDLPQPASQSTPQPAPQSARQPDQQPIVDKTPPSQPPQPTQQQPKSTAIKVAPPPSKKPDIAIKKKNEKPEPAPQNIDEAVSDLEEQKQKEQAEAARKKAEKEQQQREQEAQKQRALEEQKKREQAEQRKREQAEKARLEAQQAAARAKIDNEIGKYKAMILAKIKSRIVMPPDLPGNPVTEFNVTLLPGGDILDVRLRKSSGYPAFDSAVERAIHLSEPLPLPPDPSLFNEFRSLQVTVHYLE